MTEREECNVSPRREKVSYQCARSPDENEVGDCGIMNEILLFGDIGWLRYRGEDQLDKP